MTISRIEPVLVTRRGKYHSWGGGMGGYHETVEIADFSDEKRPAYRVACHCRNCSWNGEARCQVGEKLPQWLRCPKCETFELSAHGEFRGRDELSRGEEAKRNREADEKAHQHYEKMREIRRGVMHQ